MDKRMNGKMRLNKDNRGVALISVMITLTICILIASLALEITYTSLLTRKVNLKSDENFYTSETSVDEVETILQSVAIYAVDNMGKESFVDSVETAVRKSASIPNDVDLEDSGEAVSNYIYRQLSPEMKKMFAVDPTAATLARDNNKFRVDTVIKDGTKKTVTFKLHVKYKNSKGYVSVIDTDLVMNDKTKYLSARDVPLGSYSLFTGGGAKYVGSDFNSVIPYNYQEGNVYIGTMGKSSQALDIDKVVVNYTGGATIINGDVYVKNGGALWLTGGKVEVRGGIYIDASSTVVLGETTQLTCRDVYLDGISLKTCTKNNTSPYAGYSSNNMWKSNESKKFSSQFPFNTNNEKQVCDNGQNSTAKLEGDYKNGKYSGGLMYRPSGSECVLLKFTMSDGKIVTSCGDGSKFRGVLNIDDNIKAEAKVTIRTFDNKAYIVDPAFNVFINAPVVEYMKNDSTGSLEGKSAYVIKSAEYNDKGEEIFPVETKENVKVGDKIYSLNTFQGINNGNLAITKKDSTVNLSHTMDDGTTLNFNDFEMGFGTSSMVNILNKTNGYCLFYFIDGNFEVQSNGMNYMGILMASECCKFDFNGKEPRRTVAVSIIDGSEKESNKKSLDGIMKLLSRCIIAKNSAFNNNSYYFGDNKSYSVFMLDNIVRGGMKNFASAGTPTETGRAVVDTSQLYDFITIENWRANET